MDTMTPVDNLTYDQAMAELEDILEMLQSDNASVDTLTTLTRRAAELLKHCRNRLTATDNELRTILESLTDTGEN